MAALIKKASCILLRRRSSTKREQLPDDDIIVQVPKREQLHDDNIIEQVLKREQLPDDIIENVLSRLPARCVLKCRSVCKRWLLLTSSPYFAQLHLQRATPELIIQNLYVNVKLTSDNPQLFMIEQDDDKGRVKRLRDCLVKAETGKTLWLTACCDGLLVFEQNYCLGGFIVCNVVTREQIKIDAPPHVETSHFRLVSFFRHPLTNEYTMLFVYPMNKSCRRNYYMYDDCFKRKLWRKIAPYDHCPEFRVNPVVLNNNLIWMTSTRTADLLDYPLPECYESIIMFDTRAETFRTMPHPGNVQCRSPSQHLLMYIYETNGKLYFCSAASQLVRIWVLEDFDLWSWTKRQNIVIDLSQTIISTNGSPPPPPPSSSSSWRRLWKKQNKSSKQSESPVDPLRDQVTLMRAENNELLLCFPGRLYLVDLEGKKKVVEIDNIGEIFNPFWHTSSLVSLSQQIPSMSSQIITTSGPC